VRVSEHYSLGVTQPSLEFLDVDIDGDTRVFVDPFAFHYLDTDWGNECVSLLQDFYGEVTHAVQHQDDDRSLYLLGQLGESNEAHLGLSSGRSRGSGVADGLAIDIYDALIDSEAITTGLLTDIEQTILFVDGIGHDRLSDMTINIVREQLIKFTQEVCEERGITTVDGVDSGPMWDRHRHRWHAQHVRLPIAGDSRLLLVPKSIVRKSGVFDPGDYLTHFVLPYLQDVELSQLSSTLVRVRTGRRRRGERYVTKKSLRDRKQGTSTKAWNTEATRENPALLEAYREAKLRQTQPPDHDDLAAAAGTPKPDWDALLTAVRAIPSGRQHADDYHRAVQHLLTALFYPALDMPQRETKIHEGRKRIDITYANVAGDGFFYWLHEAGGVASGTVVVECKNYSGPLANPEFDQLTGRFSPRRGRIGLLCYRGFADSRSAVISHCRDAALDDRGYVIPLDDEDLSTLVAARKGDAGILFAYLMQRFQELI
jgi:hypothetical protein